jgi:lysophospholipase L1-like esterase
MKEPAIQRPSADRFTGGPAPGRSVYGRRLMPAGRGLVVILVTLLAWTLMYAPAMKRAAEASPLGVRRTVSLVVLTPIAAVSELFRIDALAETIERAVGRAPRDGGPFVPPPDDLPVVPTDPNDPGPGPGNGPSEVGDPIRVPTTTRRLRVVVVGDSLAAGLGYFAERVFRPRLVRVSRQGRISTGLARPDYFNWPLAMRRIVDAFDPDLVIVMLGENDHQSIQTVSGQSLAQLGTPDWPAAYRDRVLQLMRIATSRGAKVVWAGLPMSSRGDWEEHSQRMNAIYELAAGISPNVAYFDAWERFRSPRTGGYTAYLREGNRFILIREGDGLHFNAIGYTILAREIAETAVEEFGLAPRTFETEL